MATNGTGNSKKTHIDEEQAATVEEHYTYIINNEALIDSKFTEVTPKDLPDWYDPELFKGGQEYYKTNNLGVLVAALAGLALVLSVPLMKKILTFTNQSSTTCSAYKRYLETVLHTHYMYSSDVKNVNSKFWKSVNVIRWKHSNASRRCLAKELSGINQQSMVLTQFGFMGFTLLQPKMLGLTDEAEYREGLCHYWRVLGHLLGISAKMNICRKNALETTQLCRLINDRYYKKAVQDYPLDQNPLVTSMIDGCGYIAYFNRNLFLNLVHALIGLTPDRPITQKDRHSLNRFLFDCTKNRYIGFIIRKFLNYFVPFMLWVMEHCPIRAMIIFGVKESKINLYPNIKSRSS